MQKQKKSREERFAILGLVIVGICWGFGFLGLRYTDALPTLYIQSIRFAIAAAALALVFWRHLRCITPQLLKAAFGIGLLMFCCYVCATLGIKYTTAARTAFFSTLGVICVPIINFILFRVRLSKKSCFCVLLCVVGIYLISMTGGAEFGFNLGDAICLCAAFFGAGQVIAIEKLARNHDVYALTIVELAVIALLGTIGMFVTKEPIPASLTAKELITLIILGLVCSALCFILQTSAQQHVSAQRVGLILTLEPATGALASVLILHETLGAGGWLGGLCILAGILISESGIGDTAPVSISDRTEGIPAPMGAASEPADAVEDSLLR